jgi:hypothetical protein
MEGRTMSEPKRITEAELTAVGCQQCGGAVYPQDNQGSAVPWPKAVHLYCPACKVWYDPSRPPLAVLANDGGRRVVAEVRRLHALIERLGGVRAEQSHRSAAFFMLYGRDGFDRLRELEAEAEAIRAESKGEPNA